jgi:transcription-repair coupling factor (superfamily II helicase)
LEIDFDHIEEGDIVVHLQHGIAKYQGIGRMPQGAGRRHPPSITDSPECLILEFAADDPFEPPPRLYVPVTEAHLVNKYIGVGRAQPPLSRLGGKRWKAARAQAEKAIEDVASDMLRVQALREAEKGFAFAPDSEWQHIFENAFEYEETPDQLQAILDTKRDMEGARPMDRLVCGDVGFGKTEVAIRAAFKAVMSGKQVAVLAPTTVLVQQHFNTFRERMAGYPFRIENISRFRSRKDQNETIRQLALGGIDIVVGTHRLIQKDVHFKDLGLFIVDEEQRFGVQQKERIKRLKALTDVLTLTATPIPRTLYMALSGVKSMSCIQTPPQERLPVKTVVCQYSDEVIQQAIQHELNRQGQVFFLHNRVTSIESVELKLRKLVPQARIAVGHGQMESDELEEVMSKFVNGEVDILLSTTIIESGLDIPNANTIIIDRADHFGLSELYQLRGRVGRYRHQAYAYLLIPRHAALLADARKRISAIKQYSRLGSGFKIAMRDLEIRGAGNLLGSEQSGHITAIGFDLYCKLLQESISRFKGEKPEERVETRIQLDFLLPEDQNGVSGVPTDSSQLIPLSYIDDPVQRLEIYRRLAQARSVEELSPLEEELRDRFGKLPVSVKHLLMVYRVRVVASRKRITEIESRENKVCIVRNGAPLMVHGRLPRFSQKTTQGRLKELLALVESLSI